MQLGLVLRCAVAYGGLQAWPLADFESAFAIVVGYLLFVLVGSVSSPRDLCRHDSTSNAVCARRLS
jgi:hypothetical protein